MGEKLIEIKEKEDKKYNQNDEGKREKGIKKQVRSR